MRKLKKQIYHGLEAPPSVCLPKSHSTMVAPKYGGADASQQLAFNYGYEAGDTNRKNPYAHDDSRAPHWDKGKFAYENNHRVKIKPWPV